MLLKVGSSLTLLATVAGCAGLPSRLPGSQEVVESRKQVEAAQQSFQEAKKSEPAVTISSGIFLGRGRSVPLAQTEQLPLIFKKEASLVFPEGSSLETVVSQVSQILEIPIVLGDGLSATSGANVALQGPAPISAASSAPTTSASPVISASASAAKAKIVLPSMSYRGNVVGLFNTLCSSFGGSWEYRDGYVYLYKWKSKTYALTALIGKLENTLEMASGNSDLSSKHSTTSTVSNDAWKEAVENIRTIVSNSGTVTVNQSAGTLTVSATAYALSQVDDYIREVNASMSKQVAIDVSVYTLSLQNSATYGFDLSTAFKSLTDKYSLTLAGASPLLSGLSTLGSLTAVLEPGSQNPNIARWEGSKAVLQALREQGTLSLVTNASGITLNNQPMPMRDLRNTKYVSQIDVAVDANGGKIFTPKVDIVSTGFSMLVTPSVLESNNILLSCSLSLSDLIAMESFTTSDGSTVQLPDLSSKTFTQRIAVKPGSTVVLAGFQSDSNSVKADSGLSAFGKTGASDRKLVLILISTNLIKGAQG